MSLKTYLRTLGGPEDMPFTKTLRNKFVNRAPASLKGSVITLLCRVDLNATGVIGSQGSRGQVEALNGQSQSGVVIVMDRDTLISKQ